MGSKDKIETNVDDIIQELKLLTAQEVAAILEISASKVYRLAREKKLRAVRIGANVKIRPTDLREYIESNLTDVKMIPARKIEAEPEPVKREKPKLYIPTSSWGRTHRRKKHGRIVDRRGRGGV